MAKRIQRMRTTGWRMPENTVYVGRPGKWGNPFAIGQHGPLDRMPIDNEGAAGFFWDMLKDPMLRDAAGYPSDDEIKRELRGKNLACWCRENEYCHADALLEVANG